MILTQNSTAELLEGKLSCLENSAFGSEVHVHRVLVSRYIKSTMNAIQSVLASLTPGPVSSFSVDASFEEAASQCRKLCAAIHEQCQKNNICYRDIDFEIHHDLLDSRRMCLDGLDLPTTEDEPLDPKSVKRVRVGPSKTHSLSQVYAKYLGHFQKPYVQNCRSYRR